MTKKLMYWLACIALTAISCGVTAQLPTVTATVPHVTAVVPTVAAETNLQFITTAPLHLRSCAGLCEPPLDYLPQGTEIEVEVMDIPGAGCAGAAWYSVKVGSMAGFVCSIYLETK